MSTLANDMLFEMIPTLENVPKWLRDKIVRNTEVGFFILREL